MTFKKLLYFLMGYLKLQLEPNEDGTGALFANFETDGFSGHGSAWLDLNSLVESAKQLDQYPLSGTPPVCIMGGYWNDDQPATLKEEHLHISAYPSNSRGGIAVRVRVAHEVTMGDGRETLFSASVEIRASYEQMHKFSKELISLVHGEVEEIVLDEKYM